MITLSSIHRSRMADIEAVIKARPKRHIVNGRHGQRTFSVRG